MSRLPLIPLVLAAACGGTSNPSEPGVDAMGGPDSATSTDAATGSDAPPSGVDPAQDGPDTVTTSTVSVPGGGTRTLPSTVFTPSSAGPRPLVVISPGTQMERTQYTSYARHLATWGFAVVLTDYAGFGFPNHTNAATDISEVVDWALAQANLAIDPTRIAAAGHSLGGKVSVFAATMDPRIKAVVGWDPVDANSPSVAPELMTGMTAAVAVVGETTNATGGFMPCAPAADNFEQYYAAAPSPAISITVNGADHMDWVDDPGCLLCGLCDPGTAPAELARTVTRRLNVAWLRRHLFGDTAMDAWLDAPPELAGGSVAIQRR